MQESQLYYIMLYYLVQLWDKGFEEEAWLLMCCFPACLPSSPSFAEGWQCSAHLSFISADYMIQIRRSTFSSPCCLVLPLSLNPLLWVCLSVFSATVFCFCRIFSLCFCVGSSLYLLCPHFCFTLFSGKVCFCFCFSLLHSHFHPFR